MKITTDAIVPNPRWRWWAFWSPRYVAGQLSCTITEKGSGPVQPYRWRDLPAGTDGSPPSLLALAVEYDAWGDVLTIEGVKYAGELFRDLSGLGAVGDCFQIVKRDNGVVTLRSIPAPTD